jgi:MoaA/NifB/PqqE/SkfB family radical SAM enzyme
MGDSKPIEAGHGKGPVRDSNQEKNTKTMSLNQRIIKMGLSNPGLIKTGARVEYKRRVGQHLDRKLHPEKAGLPGCVSLQISRRCNLKCHMCVQYRHGVGDNSPLTWYDPKKEMPVSAWINVLDQLKSFKPWLFITGGEPTIYPHFKELIQAKSQRGLAGDVTTNGLILEGLAEFLVENRVENVIISLDGAEELHDRVRGVPGAYRKTLNGIKALVKARERAKSYAPIIALTFTITKVNLPDMEKMTPLAIDLGVDIMQFNHPIWTSEEKAALHNRILTPEFAESHGLDLVAPSLPDGEYFPGEIEPEHMPLIRDGLKKAEEQAKGRIAINIIPNLDQRAVDPFYLDADYPFPDQCNSLWQKLRILPDGTVTPCLHVVVGNVMEQTIEEIWNGEKMARFRKIVSKRLFPACMRCCDRSFKI